MVRIGGIFGRHFGGEGGCINTPSFLPSLALLYPFLSPSLPLVDASPNTDNESPFNATNQTSGDDFNASSHHMKNSTSSCCELPLSLPNLTPEITNPDPAITPHKPQPNPLRLACNNIPPLCQLSDAIAHTVTHTRC